MNALRRLSVLALAAALAGCSKSATEDEAGAPAAAPVVTVIARTQSFAQGFDAPGQWKSSTETVVPAPFEAVVESLGAQPGQRVERGEVLGAISTYESMATQQGAELLARQADDAASRAAAAEAARLARASRMRVPLRAPATGVIVRRSAGPGAHVAAGAEIVALVADPDVVFEARVPADEVSGLTPGAAATVETDGRTLDARVREQLASAGADQSRLVWLAPAGSPRAPALGLFGVVHVRTGPDRTALGVPDSAIVEDDLTGERRIAVVEAGHAHWLVIQPGALRGGWRELRGATLPAGAHVVVDGQRGLDDGAAVREGAK